MYDASGLEVKNTPLQSFYDSHNGRLPTTTIEDIGSEGKPFKDVLKEYVDKLEKEGTK